MKCLITYLSFFLIAFSSNAQSDSKKIDELMESYYNKGEYNGVILVADSGEVIYQRAFGYSQFQDSIPQNFDSKFRISSMTKQFTAMLILQLVQKKELSLTDPITMHLPYYRKETGDNITIHHLLCHQSGIPNISSFKNFRRDSIHIPLPLKFLIERWCMDDLQFEPGQNSRYSNSNYMILGAIIEELTAKSYEQVLQENILDPSGMHNTGVMSDTDFVDGMPDGYLLTDNGFVEEKRIAYSNLHAAGQMYSTPYDMYLWNQAIANNTLLTKTYQDKIFTANLGGHGYGWKVYRRLYEGQTDSCTTSYHAGGFEGFSSFIQRFHERNMVMIFMANTSQERRKIGIISDDIINILFGLPYELPLIKIAEPMTEKMFSKFVGSYTNENGRTKTILYQDPNFIYMSDSGKKYVIYPESNSAFYFAKEHRWTINFEIIGDAIVMIVNSPSNKNVIYKKQ